MASPAQGEERFWSETRLDGDLHLYRGTLRDAKEGTTCVDIESKWRNLDRAKPRQDANMQTEVVTFAEASDQSVERSSQATMTTSELHSAGSEGAGSARNDPELASAPTAKVLARKISETIDEAEDLVPFLDRVSPLMLDELERNAESTAFSFRNHAVDDRNTTVDLQHVLEPKLPTKAKEGGEKRAIPHDLVVTQISWNATGYALAASFGRFDVSGWCDLPGALLVWNLGTRRAASSANGGARGGSGGGMERAKTSSRGSSAAPKGQGDQQQQKKQEKKSKLLETNVHLPSVVIETEVCLQCCACHPNHPALVAAGSYSGEVFVWNVSASDRFESDSEVARTRITGGSHHDPVVSVAWRYAMAAQGGTRREEEAYQLISLGMDGKVLIWGWAKGGTLDAPLFGYDLIHSNPKTHKIITWGGTCMSFQQHQKRDTATFVVGTEGGGVFRCLLDDQDRHGTVGGGQSRKKRTAIKADFSFHAGMTTHCASSPFHRSLFATCGSDSVVKVFTALEKKPLLELEPTCPSLFSLCWSPVRPMFFAAGTGDGRVFFYDLAASKVHPVKVLHQEKTTRTGTLTSPIVYSTQFNPKLQSYFATTCGDGVRVWELGPQLSESPPGEEIGLREWMGTTSLP